MLKLLYNKFLTLMVVLSSITHRGVSFMVSTRTRTESANSIAFGRVTKTLKYAEDPLPLDENPIEFASGLIFKSGETNPDGFVVRKAVGQRDLAALLSWLNESDGVGDKTSKLQSYSPQDVEKYIEKGEVFLAVASDNSAASPVILASTIVRWLDAEEQDTLLRDVSPIPPNVADELPKDLVYVGGTKMSSAFTSSRGTIGNKRCISLGAFFLVETIMKSIHDRFRGRAPDARFALCSGGSLSSLSTLHLHSKITFLLRKRLKLHRRIIQEHTIPGTDDQGATMTYDVYSFNTLKENETEDIDLQLQTPAGMIMEDGPVKSFVINLARQCKVSFRLLPPATLVHGERRNSIIDIIPETSEQVEAAVAMASKQSISIDAMSRGKRWGAQSTNIPGVRLNLKRLNNIPLIDVCNGLIVVEPGVAQGQVADALRGSGWYLPVTGSCRHSSVVGNAIDGGITSAGLRIDQVVGVQAVDWETGEMIKTGALASRWHAASTVNTDPDISSSSFLFGKRAAVTKMALTLKRLPKYVTAGIVPGSMNAIRTACSLYKEGTLDWWQLRVEPGIGSVVVVETEGMHEQITKLGMKNFFHELGQKGQLVHFCTETDANDASIEGEGPFPESFLKAGLEYFRGEPCCDRHHNVIGSSSCSEVPKGGKGFKLKAYSVPANASVITLIRDEILSAAASFENEGLFPTITAVPMGSGGRYNSMYFLVWATFDRKKGSVGDRFFAAVEKVMRSTRCPPCRY